MRKIENWICLLSEQHITYIFLIISIFFISSKSIEILEINKGKCLPYYISWKAQQCPLLPWGPDPGAPAGSCWSLLPSARLLSYVVRTKLFNCMKASDASFAAVVVWQKLQRLALLFALWKAPQKVWSDTCRNDGNLWKCKQVKKKHERYGNRIKAYKSGHSCAWDKCYLLNLKTAIVQTIHLLC